MEVLYKCFIVKVFQSTIFKLRCVQLWGINFGTGADQRKHQSSASLAFVCGIHRWPVNSPHKRPVTRKMFPFDAVIMRPHQFVLAYLQMLILSPFLTTHLVFICYGLSLLAARYSLIWLFLECRLWSGTTFIFDWRADILEHVSKFLRQKMCWPGGNLDPKLRILSVCTTIFCVNLKGDPEYFWDNNIIKWPGHESDHPMNMIFTLHGNTFNSRPW